MLVNLCQSFFLCPPKRNSPAHSFRSAISLRQGFQKVWLHISLLFNRVSQCVYWAKDKIRPCLPSNATLALTRLYLTQCVSSTLALAMSAGRFKSVQGFPLPTRGLLSKIRLNFAALDLKPLSCSQPHLCSNSSNFIFFLCEDGTGQFAQRTLSHYNTVYKIRLKTGFGKPV